MKPRRKDSISGRADIIPAPPETEPSHKFAWLMPSKKNIQDLIHTSSDTTSSTSTSTSTSKSKSASALAWLDGYRGLAAVGVFNFHFFTVYTDSIVTGYGYDSVHTRIAELPFIRLLSDGGTFVNIFFIVSGYVCSLNALKAMTGSSNNLPNTTSNNITTTTTTNKTDQALRGLSSSIFRRYFRLYLPVFVITFLSAIASQLGLFEPLRPMFLNSRHFFPGQFIENSLARAPSLAGQLNLWITEMFTLSNPWTFSSYYPTHDPHLWTIPFEFRSSMHLYLALVGLSSCTAHTRMTGLLFIGLLHFMCNHWEGPLFFTGAALAQYDIIRQQRQQHLSTVLPSNTPTEEVKPHERFPTIRRIARAVLYISAFWFSTYPIAGHKRPSPGYAWMTDLIPKWYTRKEKLPKTVGTLLLTYLLCTSYTSSQNKSPNFLHRLFLTKPAQFAGRHMFGLYLVHGPYLHILGYGVPQMVWDFLGVDALQSKVGVGYLMGLGVGWFVNLGTCLVLAVLVRRFVEPWCGRILRVIEGWCFERRY